jgi:formylglycine-generating enzyme required for sulfatase activity
MRMRLPSAENRSLLCAILLLLAIEGVHESAATEPLPSSTVRLDDNTRVEQDMTHIPAGAYRLFFKREDGAKELPVRAFHVDASPISKAQFLEFVRGRPEWRKSQIKSLLAERNYLADWIADLDPGTDSQAPVTFVSWFAARAYCAERGGLPTVAEWERIAGAPRVAIIREESASDKFAPFRFAMGKVVSELQDLPLHFGDVWEWTEDFNSTPGFNAGEKPRSEKPLFCGDGYRSNNAVDYGAFLRFSLRSSLKANYTLKNLGFRCAR